MSRAKQLEYNGVVYKSVTEFASEAGFTSQKDINKFRNYLSKTNWDVDKALGYMYNSYDEAISDFDKEEQKLDKLLDNFENLCKKHKVKDKEKFRELLIWSKDLTEALKIYKQEIKWEDEINKSIELSKKTGVKVRKTTTNSSDTELDKKRYEYNKNSDKSTFAREIKAKQKREAEKQKREAEKQKKLQEAQKQKEEQLKEEHRQKEKQLERIAGCNRIKRELNVAYNPNMNTDKTYKAMVERGIPIVKDGRNPTINNLLIDYLGDKLYNRLIEYMYDHNKMRSLGGKIGKAFLLIDVPIAKEIYSNTKLNFEELAICMLRIAYNRYKNI